MTRHFYDLDKMMSAGNGEKAITGNELFETIVEHSKTVNLIRTLDYSNHEKRKLSIIPPNEVISKWKEDYKFLQENIIVGASLNWDELLERMKYIENGFNGKDLKEKMFK